VVSVSTLALLAVSAAPAEQIRLADLPDETSVHLGIALLLEDADGLKQLLAAQQDPASPSYHKWLDPESFGARFGLSESSYANALDWFASRGFAITAYPNRSFFEAVGRVDAVRASLGVQIHGAELSGKRFRTFDGEVSLPASISSRVLHISGLDTQERLRHHPGTRILILGHDGGVLGPDDLRLEYDMLGLTSTGQAAAGLTTVVLGAQEGTTTRRECDGQSPGSAPFIPPSATAIEAYLALAHATATYNPIVLSNTNEDFDTCGANQEFQLDVEMQSVGAANAKDIDLVLSPASEVFATGAQYIVNSLSTAAVVSVSLGRCEAAEASAGGGGPTTAGSEMQAVQQTIDQGLAEGQTWFAASGDYGANDCNEVARGGGESASVDFPASMPEVVAMGGTQFGSAGDWSASGGLLAFVPEVVWNESQEGGGAGGGGQSLYFSKPAYQFGIGPESGDGARDVPDLALAAASATPGVAVYACGNGQDPTTCAGDDTGTGDPVVLGGTSVASPLAAGMFALLAGKIGCNQGDVHGEIYALGKAQQLGGPKVFNDITSGNNDYVSQFGQTVQGFSAGPGYDLATGWGSIDLAALISNWPACGESTTGGTSTGAASSTSGSGSASGSSSTGGSAGATGAGGTTGSGVGTGGSSSGTSTAVGTSTGSNTDGQISSGGCSCGAAQGEPALLWGLLGLAFLPSRRFRTAR